MTETYYKDANGYSTGIRVNRREAVETYLIDVKGYSPSDLIDPDFDNLNTMIDCLMTDRDVAECEAYTGVSIY